MSFFRDNKNKIKRKEGGEGKKERGKEGGRQAGREETDQWKGRLYITQNFQPRLKLM